MTARSSVVWHMAGGEWHELLSIKRCAKLTYTA